MGQHTLADALMAVFQTTNTGIDIAYQVNMEKAKSELQKCDLEMKEAYNEYLVNINGRSDFENFQNDWDEKKTETYNDIMSKLSSPYAKKVAANQFNQMDLEQKYAIQSVVTKRKADVTLTDNANYRNAIVASTAYTGDEKRQIMQDSRRSEYESGLTTYQDYDLGLRKDGASLAYTELAKIGRNFMQQGDLAGALDSVDKSEFKYLLPDGKEMPIDAIKQQVKMDLQNEWDTVTEKKQAAKASELSEDLAQCLATGDLNYARQGMAKILKWTGDNLSEVKRTEFSEKFSSLLDPKSDKGAAHSKILQDMLQFNMQKTLNLVFQGEKNKNDPNAGYINAKTGFEALTAIGTKLLEDAGGGDPASLELFEKLKGDFYSEFEKMIPSNSPAIASKVSQIKDQAKTLAAKAMGFSDEKELDKKATTEQREAYSNALSYLDGRVWDAMMSMNMATVKPEDFDKVVNNILVASFSKQLEIIKKYPDQPTNFVRKGLESSDNVAARYIGAVNDNPDLAYVDTKGHEQWLPGVKEGTEEFRKWGIDSISAATGIPAKEISGAPELKDGGRDIDASMIFTARGKQYKYFVDGGKPVLRSRSDGGEFMPISGGSPSTRGEADKAQKDQKKATYQENTSRAADIIDANLQTLLNAPMPGKSGKTWMESYDNPRAALESWSVTDPAGFIEWQKTVKTKRKSGGR
jgi:hypothetical protein